MPLDVDKVFNALADPTRRRLLDLLHDDNGQTLGALCEHMEMTRQAVTQHLLQLEQANLVAVAWQGREKLHYLNPVLLQEIPARWIEKFEHKRLGVLRKLKQRLEAEPDEKPDFVDVTCIATTPEKLWQALTDTDLARQYGVGPTSSCARVNVSDWKPGSRWEHRRVEDAGTVDIVGKVVESAPPHRLVITWARPTPKTSRNTRGCLSTSSRTSKAWFA